MLDGTCKMSATKTQSRSFSWRPLTRSAWLDLAWWGVLCAALWYLFHLHGSNQNDFQSLFLWLNDRWNGDFAYCALLPLGAIVAVWFQRRKLVAEPRRTEWKASIGVLAGLFLHWLGMLVQHPRLSAAGFIVLLWSLPCLFYGWKFARHLLFPCGVLFMAIPLNFLDSMTAPLRLLVAQASAAILNSLGLSVVQEGAGLHAAAGNAFAFNVAPECSGLRSLFAMTALMSFYSWFTQKTLLKKWLLFCFSVPVAILANIVRVMLVVLVAAFFGQELASGLWHDYSGYPIFIVGILLMFACDRLINANYPALWTKLKAHLSSRGSSR